MTQTELLTSATTVLAVALVAVLVHIVVFRIAYRYGLRGRTADDLRRHVRWPARLVVALVAALLTVPVTDLEPEARGVARHALVIVLVLALAWLGLRVVRVSEQAAMRRFSIEMKDNLHARRKRTQALVLSRVASVVIVVVALSAVMLTFEGARTVGASLLASAGVAGLVAGIAARSTLGNLVAGIQIAFTEPIRLDDVVVVEGEWGRIEEITLTYVVVRIWDSRRLVLPTTYFVETPFQNWTRSNAQVLGAVHLHVDYTTPVDDIRAELERVLQTNDKWDGDAWVLQVVEAKERTIELRALMTAEDAPTSWDLRCEVREALVGYLQEHHPGSLPRLRVTEAEDAQEVVRWRRAQQLQRRQKGITDLDGVQPTADAEAAGTGADAAAEQAGDGRR
jgi:small-conductance mechanosensitive channel